MTPDTGDLIRLVSGHFAPDPPARLGVAVSGGSDSTALLVLLSGWVGGPEIVAVTVDHGLRAAAAEEAREVARLCARLGVAHDVPRWQGWDGRGNLMRAARDARYGLIADWARAHGIADVALGHTQDDLAETFVMRLRRGAGLDGLSAMRERFEHRDVIFHRPLLDLSRATLRGMLTARGIAWAEDPTNCDPAFDRARVREVMRALDLDPKGLAQTARHLRAARSALAEIAADTAQDLVRFDAGDAVVARAALLALPDEILRRILLGILDLIGSGGYPPRGAALLRLIDAVRSEDETSLHGARILHRKGDLRVVRDWAAIAGHRVATDQVWDGRWRAEGPDDACHIAALGEAGLPLCPMRKDMGRPAASLISGPAIWQDTRLIAAPLAGLENGWSLRLTHAPMSRLRAALLH